MLGVGDRHLRGLFQKHLGASPKQFALYSQCLFAKKLLHNTQFSVTDIALASGFKSIRRFNDDFKRQIGLSPRQIRRSRSSGKGLKIDLSYRPPYRWDVMQSFLRERLIAPLEWITLDAYGRTFQLGSAKGTFAAKHNAKENIFELEIDLDDITALRAVIDNVRRILDLDADTQAIDKMLRQALGPAFPFKSGSRLPGLWDVFEAGIRAILGQQISVKAAHTYCAQLVAELGEPLGAQYVFPTPQAVANSDLSFLAMPRSKKETLRRFAAFMADEPEYENLEKWRSLKGIGPWTVQYAQLRGQSQPDIYMHSDLGILKMEKTLPNTFSAEAVAPWRSYLTLQFWRQL